MKLMNLFMPGQQQDQTQERGPRKAVVALGGGGARGLAHLGTIQAIGESGVQIERIVGVSMGSLAGALCAVTPDTSLAQAKTTQLLHSPTFQKRQRMLFGGTTPEDQLTSGIFSWFERAKKYLHAHRKLTKAVTSPALMSDIALQEAIDHLLPDINIQDLPIPMSVVAVDLLSGQRVILENGPLRKAIRASTAIPGIFPAVRWDDMLLSDIGVIESVPALIASSYASDLTIAVDVGQTINRVKKCDTAIEALLRMDDICESMIRPKLMTAADILIQPKVGHYPWFDFTHPERLIEEGHRAAHLALAEIESNQAA
ncbi:MAG: patatin-like phospholipase family protein [Rubripirellula sp.]